MGENGNDKHVITCPYCQQRFSVKIPALDMFNDLRVSTVIAAHEKPIRCMNNQCSKRFVLGFKAVEVSWVPIPITDEQAATLEDSPIIFPSLQAVGSLH